MAGDERTSSNSAIGALLGYVRDHWGDDVVAAVLGEAGETRPLAELQDPTYWSTAAQAEGLFQAAQRVTGDDDLPRKVGAELLIRYSSSEVVNLFRSIDDMGLVLQLVTEAASKMTTALVVTCVEVGERHALVSARPTSDRLPSGRTCEYAEGIFRTLPVHQGMPPAEVIQLECLARGDDQCLYEIRWDPEGATDPAVQVRYLRQQVDALTLRFEALEEMATDLAQVTEVDELLERIIHRAGLAVRAPHYMLAVTLPGEHQPRVHHVGFTDDEVARAADDILADEPDDHGGSRLIVDVAATGTWYGRLGALYPSGHRFLPAERRLLAAYAGHAAAALHTAALMADRRRQADTNAALLGLSAALAELSTARQVALRLAAAVPGVVACDHCAVLVAEPDDDHLVLQARSAAGPGTAPRRPPDPPGPATPDRTPMRVQLTTPMRVRLATAAEPAVTAQHVPELAPVLQACAVGDHAAAVPLLASGDLLALIVIGWDTDPSAASQADPAATSPGHPTDAPAAAARAVTLAGVAGLAATAFHNARLVQRIEHQAQHDPLTGLANLRLFRELATVALANAQRRRETAGLLFVDLDGFKAVNDRLGHATGDTVLAHVSERLRRAVRTGDTVARLGGDEFVVLLPVAGDEAEAVAVAGRILQAVGRPIPCPAGPVTLSASIGIAMSGGDEDVDTLLAEADVAMYRAKTAGGGRSEPLAAPGTGQPPQPHHHGS